MGWGSAILGLAGGVFGSLSKNWSLGNQESLLNERKKSNQSWFDRRYNEDVTQRVDAQRLLTNLEESLARRNKEAEGRRAVIGGTAESVAAEKEANSRAMADATAQIAAAGEARKAAIEQQYLNRKDKLDDKLLGIEADKDTPLDTASKGIGGFANGLGYGSFSSGFNQ